MTNISGFVRDVKPITIDDLWARKNSLQHNLSIIREQIVKHETAKEDYQKQHERVLSELKIISKHIKQIINKGD